MVYSLRAPASDEDWQAFHDIRETVLFVGRRSDSVYDRRHPDDIAPKNHPLLFSRDGEPIGTIRLDELGNNAGAVRLVAILPNEQRKGNGRVMAGMCDDTARALGLNMLFVNAAPEAIGFYEKTGWEHFSWNPAELVSIAKDCVQMRRRLA